MAAAAWSFSVEDIPSSSSVLAAGVASASEGGRREEGVFLLVFLYEGA
jgi:hypothetical protein